MQTALLRILAIVIFLSVTAFASASQVVQANEVLLSAMSPFEDMIEFALSKNAADVSKALVVADRHASDVSSVLPPPALSEFNTLMKSLHEAVIEKNHHLAARNAVEVFRLLIDNLHAEGLQVPREVSLLDCAGFKLRVLAASQRPNWQDIRETVKETTRWWNAINSKVSQKGLRNAFGSVISGLDDAVTAKNLPLLGFAAQIVLDLVDLIEDDLKTKR